MSVLDDMIRRIFALIALNFAFKRKCYNHKSHINIGTLQNSNTLEYVIPIATVIGEITMINIIAAYTFALFSLFRPIKPADNGNRNAE